MLVRLCSSCCCLSLLLACGGSPASGDAKAKPDQEPAPATKAPAEDPTEPAPAAKTARTWSFDDAKAGPIPAGFRVTETGSSGTPATWATVADPTAPTAPNAFGITETKNPKATYNLALAEGTEYGDVDISVMVKAGTGELDQGGGPIWRVIDEDNYYIARWNPLEKNARFYIVQSGSRSALGKVELDLDPAAWHSLRVVSEGAVMQLFIDDEPVLRVEDDTHKKPGQVGLWTKADAATWFDDLSVTTP
ncbi:MAG: hypothetical protein AAF799_05290 [Myxococcota bacterium]